MLYHDGVNVISLSKGLATLWFKNVFVKNVGRERPVVLLFDGHRTHTHLELVEHARAEDITLIELPPHTSHILQPLDK